MIIYVLGYFVIGLAMVRVSVRYFPQPWRDDDGAFFWFGFWPFGLLLIVGYIAFTRIADHANRAREIAQMENDDRP